MEDFEILRKLPENLLPWYESNRRELPWRKDKEPYHIWLSEIMLQQTRVEAVKNYYTRFLAACPTISSLAEAEDDALRKLWEGLGYYSRVRNLKKAAQVIMNTHGGVFPEEYEAVRALPGIGDYTAGAICSIAFGQPTPAVDGNVLRVLSRLLLWQEAIDLPLIKRQARGILEEIYPRSCPGDFTQALMELGATVCLPSGEPKCENCPMRELCRAKKEGCPQEYPKRLPKKPRKTEEKTVFILACREYIALRQREEQGLLAGLWEFPHVPGCLDEKAAIEQAEKWGLCPRELLLRADRIHIFTHIQWNLRGYRINCREMPGMFTWLTRQEIKERIALPTAFRQFWDLTENEKP